MSTTTGALFADRADASRRLADALAGYRSTQPLVLGIPRGGVPMAAIVAEALGGELDVVLVRKLRAPNHPEFAIGAIDESGTIRLSELARRAGADARYVAAEAERQLATLRQRRNTYSPGRQPRDPAGRTVIVVDDGLATGSTMCAALAAVRRAAPAKIVCAIPVASPNGLDAVRDYADEICCLNVFDDFRAVGMYYADFAPVDDVEVIRVLNAGPRARPNVADAGTRPVQIAVGDVMLQGDLGVPPDAAGLVLFAHGSGSGRASPRNRYVADVLRRAGFATLLFDLLTEREEAQSDLRFDIALLARRLDSVVGWAQRDPRLRTLPFGLFGASTGAAAALTVAARRGSEIAAVVSRGGRPDLAGAGNLSHVTSPTLLLVGDRDREVIELNRMAQSHLRGAATLTLVPGATHLFEEPGTLEQVSQHAAAWFRAHFSASAPTVSHVR